MTDRQTPRKDDSFVSKAIEYMFGWWQHTMCCVTSAYPEDNEDAMDKWMKYTNKLFYMCACKWGSEFVAVYFLTSFRIVRFLHFCFNKDVFWNAWTGWRCFFPLTTQLSTATTTLINFQCVYLKSPIILYRHWVTSTWSFSILHTECMNTLKLGCL